MDYVKPERHSSDKLLPHQQEIDGYENDPIIHEDQFKQCFICAQQFDAESRAPYALPCHHSICMQCMIYYRREGKQVECLFDNEIVSDASHLQRNTELIKYIQGENMEYQSQLSSQRQSLQNQSQIFQTQSKGTTSSPRKSSDEIQAVFELHPQLPKNPQQRRGSFRTVNVAKDGTFKRIELFDGQAPKIDDFNNEEEEDEEEDNKSQNDNLRSGTLKNSNIQNELKKLEQANKQKQLQQMREDQKNRRSSQEIKVRLNPNDQVDVDNRRLTFLVNEKTPYFDPVEFESSQKQMKKKQAIESKILEKDEENRQKQRMNRGASQISDSPKYLKKESPQIIINNEDKIDQQDQNSFHEQVRQSLMELEQMQKEAQSKFMDTEPDQQDIKKQQSLNKNLISDKESAGGKTSKASDITTKAQVKKEIVLEQDPKKKKKVGGRQVVESTQVQKMINSKYGTNEPILEQTTEETKIMNSILDNVISDHDQYLSQGDKSSKKDITSQLQDEAEKIQQEKLEQQKMDQLKVELQAMDISEIEQSVDTSALEYTMVGGKKKKKKKKKKKNKLNESQSSEKMMTPIPEIADERDEKRVSKDEEIKSPNLSPPRSPVTNKSLFHKQATDKLSKQITGPPDNFSNGINNDGKPPTPGSAKRKKENSQNKQVILNKQEPDVSAQNSVKPQTQTQLPKHQSMKAPSLGFQAQIVAEGQQQQQQPTAAKRRFGSMTQLAKAGTLIMKYVKQVQHDEKEQKQVKEGEEAKTKEELPVVPEENKEQLDSVTRKQTANKDLGARQSTLPAYQQIQQNTNNPAHKNPVPSLPPKYMKSPSFTSNKDQDKDLNNQAAQRSSALNSARSSDLILQESARYHQHYQDHIEQQQQEQQQFMQQQIQSQAQQYQQQLDQNLLLLRQSSQGSLKMVCELHPQERIKYFCRDCRVGLCPECVVYHAKHDFVFADEGAAFEVKQQLKTLSLSVQSKQMEYQMLMTETDQKFKEIERFKEEEFNKLRFYFAELHKCLDQREDQIKRQYIELMKDAQSYLNLDIQKLTQILANLDQVNKQIGQLNKGFERAAESAIVGSSDRIKNISQTFVNFSKRLTSKHPAKSFTIRSKDMPTVPTFNINLSQIKKYLDNLGSLQQPLQFKDMNYASQEPPIEDVQIQQQNDLVLPPIVNEQQDTRQLDTRQSEKSRSLARPQTQQLLKTPEELAQQNQQLGNTFPLKNEKLQQQIQLSRSQQLQQLYQQMPGPENVFWPKWDSFEVFKFDFFNSEWNLMQDAQPQSKFLFFSSISHLPKNLGMFILGGSDSDDNFSKRVILYSRYQKFIEKPPMIYKRAFFPSVFCLSDSNLYVFGGHDGEQDLNSCERYSIAENVWRQVAPMNSRRNGSSVIAFDRVLFLFGGNNQEMGSLDSIERYFVEFDKWTYIQLRLREPVHDTLAFNIGGGRVLIFGGSINGQPNVNFNIYDMTCEILNQDDIQYDGAKIYLPPVYDPNTGALHIFKGYGDAQVQHEKLKIGSLFCKCRSSEFKGLFNQINSQQAQIQQKDVQMIENSYRQNQVIGLTNKVKDSQVSINKHNYTILMQSNSPYGSSYNNELVGSGGNGQQQTQKIIQRGKYQESMSNRSDLSGPLNININRK